jgi:UDP-glucose 4-epimerase
VDSNELDTAKYEEMILVTGGAGYVGSHFVRTYLDNNPDSQVVVIDNLLRGNKKSLPVLERLSVFACDIADYQVVSEIFKQFPIEAVVHFAAKAYVGESQSDPFGYLQNNVAQTIKFFEIMEEHAVRKVVFSSSCQVYGEPQYLPVDEKHQLKPTNMYGTSKLVIEETLSSLTDSLGWSSISLRYFNAAGASEDGQHGESHDPETHLIPTLLRVASGALAAATIYGTDHPTEDGTCVRDYVHISDLAQAHCQALSFLQTVENPKSLAFNLGTAVGASILTVLKMCEEVTGRSIPVIMAKRRPGDPAAMVANASMAKQILGWENQYDLQRVIEHAWQWQKNPRY